MTMSSSTITGTARYLTFRLGDELFAVNVFKTREVLDLAHITRVPAAPDFLRGVVNVRGNSIPVVDLRLKFGLPALSDTRNTRIIVLELALGGESTVVGGLADAVHEVVELDRQEINEAPALGTRWRADLILGLGRRGERFILILDIERAFAAAELTPAATPVATSAH